MEQIPEQSIDEDYFTHADVCATDGHVRVSALIPDTEAYAVTAQAIDELKGKIVVENGSTTLAVLICDRGMHDLPMVYASPSLESLTGYHRSELLGRNCRLLQRPCDLTPDRYVGPLPAYNGYDPNRTVIRRKINDGDVAHVRIINYHKTGRAFLNELTIVPIDFNRSHYYVGFAADISPRHDPYGLQLSPCEGLLTVENVDKECSSLDAANSSHRTPSTATTSNAELVSSTTQTSSTEANVLFSTLSSLPNHIVLVTSLSGHILFLSGDVERLLGLPPHTLHQRSLFDVLHEHDVSAFRAEFRKLGPGSGCEIICRASAVGSNSVYIDFRISRAAPSKTIPSYMVLSGHLLPAIAIPEHFPAAEVSNKHSPIWAKISTSGLVLFGTSALKSLFHGPLSSDRTPEEAEVVGLSLQSRLCQQSRRVFEQALATMGEGLSESVGVHHCFARPDGSKLVMMSELILPQSHSQLRTKARASVILVRMQYAVGESKCALFSKKRSSRSGVRIASHADCDPACIAVSPQPPSWSLKPPALDADQRSSEQSYPSSTTGRLLQIKPVAQDQSSADPTVFGFDPPLEIGSSPDLEPMLPQDQDACWQYSVRSLAVENFQLRKDLQELLTRQSIRFKRARAGLRGQVCVNCGTMDTPEWRKGPLGRRNLCNRCGLRYAKSKLKEEQGPGIVHSVENPMCVVKVEEEQEEEQKASTGGGDSNHQVKGHGGGGDSSNLDDMQT